MTTRFAKRLSDVVAAPERTVASMAHHVPDIWVDNQGPARRRMRRRAWNLPDGVRALLRRPGLLGLRELTFRVWGGGVFRGMRGAMSHRTWAVFAVAALVVGSAVGVSGE